MGKKGKGFAYTVLLQPEMDPEFRGYYNASVPALPGCFSYGATKEEAMANIKEAIQLYVEDMLAHGEIPPEEKMERVRIAI